MTLIAGLHALIGGSGEEGGGGGRRSVFKLASSPSTSFCPFSRSNRISERRAVMSDVDTDAGRGMTSGGSGATEVCRTMSRVMSLGAGGGVTGPGPPPEKGVAATMGMNFISDANRGEMARRPFFRARSRRSRRRQARPAGQPWGRVRSGALASVYAT